MKRLSQTDRERRIRELWHERPRRQRTSADVLNFYYGLSQHEPNLTPDGPGSYQQLCTILGDAVKESE